MTPRWKHAPRCTANGGRGDGARSRRPRPRRLGGARSAAPVVRELWPARLWHDGVQWRGPGWLEGLDAKRFNWDRLRPLVSGGRIEPDRILAELKARVRPWMDADEDGIRADAGDLRFRARPHVERRVDDACQRLGA